MSPDTKDPYGVAICIAGGACPATEIAGHEVIQGSLRRGNDVFIIREGLGGLMRKIAFEPVTTRKESYAADLMSEASRDFIGEENALEARNFLSEECKKHNIKVVATIGGDGTAKGYGTMMKQSEGGPLPHVLFAPKTIDGDVLHTDKTIGFDSAVEEVDSALRRARRDSFKMRRAFFMQIPGRDAGHLTFHGAQNNADIILVPEAPFDTDTINAAVKEIYLEQRHCLIAVSEGFLPKDVNPDEVKRTDAFGNNAKYRVAEYLSGIARQQLGSDEAVRNINPQDAKYINNGSYNSEYVRGAEPTKADARLASEFGRVMVEYGDTAIDEASAQVAFVLNAGEIKPIPLPDITRGSKPLSPELYNPNRLFVNRHKAALFH